jgi:Cdc6-like AAA superfamily ATPase
MQSPAFNKIDQILVEHTPFVAAKTRLIQHYLASRTCAEPVCLAIIGESRSGKSRVLDHVTLQYPSERRDEGMYMPILIISTPSKPTVKGLAEKLLLALSDPLWNRRASENEKTERLIVLLKQVGTTMIIIDEFQHFYDKSSHKIQHHVADWLKTLVDRARIALVVAGLPSCMAVISQNEQLSGRFTGAIQMPRFDWLKDGERGEFISILEAFQNMLTEYEFPDLTSDAMAFRFYCATGGLIDYIAKILRQAMWDALFENRTVIDLGHLAKAYDEAVWQHSPLDSINPFSPGFSPVATPQWLEYARSVGTTDTEAEALPQAVLKKATLAEALSTKG